MLMKILNWGISCFRFIYRTLAAQRKFKSVKTVLWSKAAFLKVIAVTWLAGATLIFVSILGKLSCPLPLTSVRLCIPFSLKLIRFSGLYKYNKINTTYWPAKVATPSTNCYVVCPVWATFLTVLLLWRRRVINISCFFFCKK